MKKNVFLWVLILAFFDLHAQENGLAGSWGGSLEVMGQKLPLLFHFEKNGDEWEGTADSPTQGAKGLLLKNILYNGLMVSLEFEQLPASYEGVMVGDTLKGNFTQSGSLFPLNLTRSSESEAVGMERPQEPKPPFEYEEIETSFGQETKLMGTLTRPKGKGPFPAVVLVSGSGPQNRNGEIFGHQPFWVIADFLSNNNLVVLRYDERGVGESEGDFAQTTSQVFKDDASEAVIHLKSFPFVDQNRVGVIGHSEGGMIGWMLASQLNNLDFLVALAAPVIPIDQLMEQQTEAVLKTGGASQQVIDERLDLNKKIYQVVKDTENLSDLEGNLEVVIRKHLASLGVDEQSLEAETAAVMESFLPTLTPWMFEFMKFSSEPYIEQIEVPVFAAFGGKDIQVDAAANAEALLKMTSRKEQFRIVTYPNLNHLFQTSETGGLAEYGTNSETFNEQVLKDVVQWINGLR